MSKAKRNRFKRQSAPAKAATLWDDLPLDAKLTHNGNSRHVRRKLAALKRAAAAGLLLMFTACATDGAEPWCIGAHVDSSCPIPQCKADGVCSRDDAGCCIAKFDGDCEVSDACMEYGRCIASGGVCVEGGR